MAHAVDFLVVYRADPEREYRLAATGHGYWPVAVVMALFAGLSALAGAASRGGARGLGLRLGATATESPAPRSIAGDIARLAATQMVLFATVEVLERIVAGVAPATLVQAPEFLVGLVLQVVVAAVAVVILLVVERVSEKVVRGVASTARRRPSPSPSRRPRNAPTFAGATLGRAARPRAPPLATAA